MDEKRAKGRGKEVRILTESVEVLHAHAMRESKRCRIEWRLSDSADERQDGG
jgi:hypothetical protein